MFFKDNTIRKIQTGNLPKVIEVNNSIYSSGLAVHRNDKTLANQEPPAAVEPTSDDDGSGEGDEDGTSWLPGQVLLGTASYFLA